MAGAIAGCDEKGRALAMLNTPRSLALSFRQHIGDEGQVDGHVHAEAESADGHADEKAVEAGGGSDHEQSQAVHGRRGEDEDLSREEVRSLSLPKNGLPVIADREAIPLTRPRLLGARNPHQRVDLQTPT